MKVIVLVLCALAVASAINIARPQVGDGEKYVTIAFYDDPKCGGSNATNDEAVITTGCHAESEQPNSFVSFTCESAGVATLFGCDSTCKKCRSNPSQPVPVGKCENGRIMACTNTLPTIPTGAIVETGYSTGNCTGDIVDWNIRASACHKEGGDKGTTYGIISCVSGKPQAKEGCKDNTCTTGCQTHDLDTMCHMGHKYSCAGSF